MVIILGLDDIKNLRGRHHAEELVVIGLLDTLQLQFHLIALLDHLLTGSLISRFDPHIITHLVIERALLLLHLPEKGEESGSLLRCETSLLGDILLQISLVLLWRESLLLLLEILLREALTVETVLREAAWTVLIPRPGSKSAKRSHTNQTDNN